MSPTFCMVCGSPVMGSLPSDWTRITLMVGTPHGPVSRQRRVLCPQCTDLWGGSPSGISSALWTWGLARMQADTLVARLGRDEDA